MLTTDAVLIAMMQDADVVFFGLASHTVAATGTHNPNGLQQESELLTIPSLWINSKNGNRSVPPALIPHFTISPRGGYASVTVELGARQVRVRKIGRPTLLL